MAAAAPAPFVNASLYVGDIGPEVSEAMLYDIFNQVGPVSSIRVCRDHFSRRSLGYAYVNFHNAVDAERALDTLNYTPINAQPCRIMWSHRDPSIRRSGKGNVFIKNLDKTIDNKALYDTFSAFGNILSCKVATGVNGESFGYGFVHFETEEGAQRAREKVNGMSLNGREVYVGPFVPRKDRTGTSADSWTNVYVKNLDESVTEEMLEKEFGEHGTVTSAVVMKDRENGKSRGFGFVNMETHEQALAVVEALNNKEIAGKAIVVCRAQKKSEREKELRQKFAELKELRYKQLQGVNLYVKNLSDDVDDDRLRQEFEKFGTITSAKVMRDDKGVSRGFGFVCFSSADEATRAVTGMNNAMVGAKPLYVALAMRKEVRRAQLEVQHLQRTGGMRGVPQGPAGAPGVGPGVPQYQPMFYAPNMQPGMPGGGVRGAGGGFMYPQQMGVAPRPRWAPGVGPAQPQRVPAGYAAAAGMSPYGGGMMPMPRQPRQPRRGMAPPAGGVPPQQPGGGPMGPAGPVPAGRGRGGPGPRPQGSPGGPVGQAGPQAGFKYTSNVRNNREAQAAQQQMPLGGNGEQPALTATALAAAKPEQQKQMLGERLYPLVHASQTQPELAAKITGMLLEMDNGELLHLLESPEALNAKVNEAIQVLHMHQAQQQAAAAAAQQQAMQALPGDGSMAPDGGADAQAAPAPAPEPQA